MMVDGNVLCDAAGLDDGKPVAAKDSEGRDLVVVGHGGKIPVLDGVCPHRGAPLAEGWVADGCLVCPWHGWSFDVKTGKHAPGVAISVHACSVVDGKVRLKS